MNVPTTKQTTRDFINEMKASTKEIITLLDQNGVPYNLKEWITIADYAKKFGISNTSTISAAISRGTIPAENVIEINALNGLKLIKAVDYRKNA